MSPLGLSLALLCAQTDPGATGGDDADLPTDTPPVPTAELRSDLPPRRAESPEILYINFDGGILQSGCGNDPHHDCSTLAETFSGYVGPFEGDLGQRLNILTQARKDVADFGIQVVVERPPDDVPYTMVMYGDLGAQSFAGIAPYIDCEDRRGGDLSFTQGFVTSQTGSTVILQEAAHTWGLEHVDAPSDILNPFKASGLNQSFLDQCFKIVANTELEPTSGSCNQIHTKFCDVGYQNSWQEMMYLFGPHVPDTVAPTVEFTSPEDGSVHALPITIPLLADVTDNLHPQFYRIELYVNDNPEPEFADSQPMLDLLINNPDPGDYELRAVVTDEEGNVAEDVVHFTILPEGSELPKTEAEEDEPMDPESAGCRVPSPSSGGGAPVSALLFGLLLPLLLRRRAR